MRETFYIVQSGNGYYRYSQESVPLFLTSDFMEATRYRAKGNALAVVKLFNQLGWTAEVKIVEVGAIVQPDLNDHSGKFYIARVL